MYGKIAPPKLSDSLYYADSFEAFQTALKLKPRDYSLWNKLGATQENGVESADVISAYQHDLAEMATDLPGPSSSSSKRNNQTELVFFGSKLLSESKKQDGRLRVTTNPLDIPNRSTNKPTIAFGHVSEEKESKV
nr:hypothetical protein [Tanacetum cinerariifolium]